MASGRARLDGLALGAPVQILVTGANSITGHAVIRHLVACGAGVTGLIPDAATQGAIAGLGATPFAGDMRDVVAVRQAMAGCERVYHICPAGTPGEVEIGEAVIAAAQESPIALFGYHSVIAPHIEEIPSHWAKMQVQMALMRAGLPFSVVQPALTMADLMFDPVAIRGAGELALPFAPDTPLPWVDIEDVGAAVAALMTKPGQQGGTYELCGTGQPLTPRDMAKHMTAAFGVAVEASVCSFDAFVERLPRDGIDAGQAASFRALADYLGRTGLRAGNPNVLTLLLGRQPTTFEQFLTRLAGE